MKFIRKLLIIVIILTFSLAFLTSIYYFEANVYLKKELNTYKNTNKLICEENNEKVKYIKTNAEYYFPLRSEDGSNEAYHPKVISFEEKWNGYKYWMTYSPFPKGNEKYENPWIVASNDLLNWEEPEGIKNPVEGTPKNFVAKKIYNSDPHIFYNSDTDTLGLVFRFVDDVKHKAILYYMSSKDGVNWTDKVPLIETNRTKNDIISPSIIYEDGIYKMWYVEGNRTIKYTESTDLYNWSKARVIKMSYYLKELTTWHLDVIHTEKGYEMVISAYKYWADRNSMNLYYSFSTDNVNYSKAKTILRPSNNGWDDKGIYRSSLLFENDMYYLFYSGQDVDQTRGIGLAYGKDIFDLKGIVKE